MRVSSDVIHQPTQKRFQARLVAIGGALHRVVVVTDQGKKTGVQIWNLVKFKVSLLGSQRSDRSVKTSRVAKTSVFIAGDWLRQRRVTVRVEASAPS